MPDLKQDSKPDSIKKIIGLGIFLVLLVVTFFIIKPFISVILTAIFFAYILRPIYSKIDKKIKNSNVSAGIISFILIILFVVFAWFAVQVISKEVLGLYTYSQTHDLTAPIKSILQYFVSDKSSLDQITSLTDRGIEKATTYILSYVNDLILSIPQLAIQLFVLFFVFFFFLKDADTLSEYFKSLLPFKESAKDRFLLKFKSITNGVIYGILLIGIIQGICTGIGLWIFGVPQAFILTIVATVAAIIPFLGAWVVWIPAAVAMIINGNVSNGVILLAYGFIVVSFIDNLLRPYIIGKKSNVNFGIITVGMLGGLELFGIIGLIIGPLIIDYLIIFIDFYRTHQLQELI
jgi:predicted PurR-regulated permease PerM